MSDTVAAMAPGTFVELETQGLTDNFMKSGCASPVTSFSDSAVWDSVGRSFLYIGGPHGCPHSFIRYSESANSWTKLEPYSSVATHGYDHNTIDVASRTYFFRKHGVGGIHAYDIDSGTWDLQAVPDPSGGSPQISGGLKFFPGLNALVHLNYTGIGEVEVLDNGTWNRLTSVSMGRRDAFSEYNPVRDEILFGGGMENNGEFSDELYVLDASRNVIKMTDAPVTFFTHKTIVTVDPASGRYVVFDNSRTAYEYDSSADSWKALNLSVPFFQNPHVEDSPVTATVAAPVTNYGVVMFLQYLSPGNGGSKVWLYKHDLDAAPNSTSVDLATNRETLEPGQAATLTWTSTNTESCTASGDWEGTLPPAGSLSTGPLIVDSTFLLTCEGSSGSSVGSVIVDVVEIDTTAPAVSSAFATGDSGIVRIRFSEPVDSAVAQQISNYAIDRGVSVLSATAQSDMVLLGTTPLAEGVAYTLTINNVADLAASPNVIETDTQVSFTFAAGVDLSGTTPAGYEWGFLAYGERVYVDRIFTYAEVPEPYRGLVYLRTANDDKARADPAAITFQLLEPVTVYVGYDARISTRPAWLDDWTDTGDALITTDATLELYGKDFQAGTVALGGNNGGSNSMYAVVVKPRNTGPINNQPVAEDDTLVVKAGYSGTVIVLANDRGMEDGFPLVSIVDAPTHGVVRPAGFAGFSYTANAQYGGEDSFRYRLIDRDGDYDEANVLVTVRKAQDSDTTRPPGTVSNASPEIAGWPPFSAPIGSVYSFTPEASDPDGDTLMFSVDNLPKWASFDSATGTLSGTPHATDAGSYSGIVISVSDGNSSASLPPFAIVVYGATGNGTVTFSWVPPVQNEDGSALDNLAGYRFYYGPASGNYTTEIAVANPGISSYVFENLTPGRYFFSSRAENSNGMLSVFSAEVTVDVE